MDAGFLHDLGQRRWRRLSMLYQHYNTLQFKITSGESLAMSVIRVNYLYNAWAISQHRNSWTLNEAKGIAHYIIAVLGNLGK